MKKILFFSAICLVACTGQTGKSSAEADSVSNVVEEVDPYVSVSSASEADVIEFVAEGSYSPIQARNASPQEVWKYTVNTRMENEGGPCQLKVHSEIWDTGATHCQSQSTDVFKGHWTVKATLEGRNTRDWYCYSGVNDKGDKFAFRVSTSFNNGYTEIPSFPMTYKISNVEMKKLKGENDIVTANNAETNDAKVIAKIQEFYKDYVFGRKDVTDEVITKYCTQKLAKKLADDYEYEGGGYAIWDFRSGAQDGDSDVQELTNVYSLGNGVYKVRFNDMGTKGSCNISVIVEGDRILFDEIN